MLGALADDGALLDDASPELKRLRIGCATSARNSKRACCVR